MGFHALIIGYGNPLRSDDGIGWHAAEVLQLGMPPLETEVICVHQLTPELAEAASRADYLLFLDAACQGNPGQMVCSAVCPNTEAAQFSHQLTPEQLLTLCRQLYGTYPHAYTLSVAAETFDHGETLSEPVRKALPLLLTTSCELLARLSQTNASLEEARF